MVSTRDYLLRVTAGKAGAMEGTKSQRNSIHRRDITGFVVKKFPRRVSKESMKDQLEVSSGSREKDGSLQLILVK